MRNLQGITAALCAGALLTAAAARASSSEGVRTAAVAPSAAARLEVSGLSLAEGPSILEDSSAAVGGEASVGGSGSEDRNPMLAVLMSCVLPGWGEMYAGDTARGRAFMAAEAAIWLAYGGFTIQQGMREDDYREYAGLFAGVPDGAGSGYYEDIADYIRSEGYDSYNEAVRDDARSLYPDDPAAQDAYFAEFGYFGDAAWDWESDARLREYRHLRHLAGESDRKAFYMTGLAVLNRAVSAIDSAWMARRGRRQGASGARASLSITPDLDDGRLGARATFEVRF
jgi:hypothetical protein